MEKTMRLFSAVGVTLLLALAAGCSSTGSSTVYGGHSTTYYHSNSWDYDDYYRDGVNRDYNRRAAAGAAAVRSERQGGSFGGGGRGGGGRGGGRR